MKKRGISPLIASVLLIGFAVSLAVIVTNWGTGFLEQTQESVEQSSKERINCFTDVEFSASCTCSTGGDTKVDSCTYTIKNYANLILSNTTARYFRSDSFLESQLGPQNIDAFGVAEDTDTLSSNPEGDNVKLEVLATNVQKAGKTLNCGETAKDTVICTIT